MYKNILIPTDGSELSQMAVKEAVALAKALNAKVTGVTVTLPFHVFALDPQVVTDTPETYETDMKAIAQKYLQFISDAAGSAGVACETLRVNGRLPLSGHHRYGEEEGLRPDLYGLAWPHGLFCAAAW